MNARAGLLARRQQVAVLWLRALPSHQIARQLDVPQRTIERDVQAVRADLDRANLASLESKRARSVAALHQVQAEAWQLYGRLGDTSSSKVGCLNTIANAESTIGRLEGTLTGDHITQQTTVNVLASEDWLRTRGVLLATLARFPEARGAVVEALRALEPAQDQQDQKGTRKGMGADGPVDAAHDDDDDQ
jgi:hypothetical protein